MKWGLIDRKKFSKASLRIWRFGELYTSRVSCPRRSSTCVEVACRCSLREFSFSWWQVFSFISTAVPPWAFPSGYRVLYARYWCTFRYSFRWSGYHWQEERQCLPCGKRFLILCCCSDSPLGVGSRRLWLAALLVLTGKHCCQKFKHGIQPSEDGYHYSFKISDDLQAGIRLQDVTIP